MAGPSHKLYIDESGTKEYSQSGTYQIGHGPTPYFVFAGILITPSAAGDAAQRLRQLKMECFGVDTVEIKANWLKRAQEREKRYLDPFGITPEKLNQFVGETYRLLGSMDARFIASLVDKQEVQKRYGTSAWYAPTIAYECLMQRAHKEMEKCDGLLSVTVDDMSGATPKGNQYKSNLATHHHKLRKFGSTLHPSPPMARLDNIGFSDSKADERLQLADLIAYATLRQFVDYSNEWDAGGAQLPTYPYFDAIASKFVANANGVFSGYGVVRFPRRTWAAWRAEKNEPQRPT